MTLWFLAGSLLLAVSAYLLLSGFAGAYRRFRGTRVITCPENHEPAAVRVDALNAAHWAAVAGEPVLRVDRCSRWPEKAGCDQACLTQIRDSSDACLLQNMVGAWYEGKDCVYCRKAAGPIRWDEHPPALRGPDGTMREWTEFSPQQLPLVFLTHQPVCWRCHIVEGFRRDHADLVIERTRRAEPVREIAPTAAVY